MTNVLDTELCTYAEHRSDLLRTAEGKFVLIDGEEVAAVYTDEMDAIAEG